MVVDEVANKIIVEENDPNVGIKGYIANQVEENVVNAVENIIDLVVF